MHWLDKKMSNNHCSHVADYYYNLLYLTCTDNAQYFYHMYRSYDMESL